MNVNSDTDLRRGPSSDERSELTKELIHELQNHLHLAIMEVELVQLGVSAQCDCAKLLGILNSSKQSLRALRDCLLPSVGLPNTADLRVRRK